jgi:glycosyltransferase involved in cell wall biosynthesis
VLSGQPYPELDVLPDGRSPSLTKVPGLDLYREPDPFRIPHWREFRGPTDVLEFALMCTAAFPEPLTFSLRARRELAGRAERPDVVHDNQTLGWGLLLLQRAGFRVLATLHHPITVDRRHDLAAAAGWRKQLSTRRWYSFLRMQGAVARRLPGVLTVSQSSADDAVRDFGLDPQRLTVVPVGVDTDVFVPPTEPRVPGRIVATASADVPLKGLVPLLEAVAKLRTERDVELVVVGRAKEGGAAAAAIERLGLAGAVRFVSGRERGPSWSRCSARPRSPSSPASTRASACRPSRPWRAPRPLVATTAGALPEVVGPDGESALHVPPGDPEALAAAVGRLLDDPALAAGIGAAGRARVVERFTWRAVAEQTAAWYRTVLEGPRADRRLRALPRRPGAPRARHGLRRRAARVRALPPGRRRRRRSTWTPQSSRTSPACSGPWADEGEAPVGATASAVRGTAYALPFADASFDRVVAAEVLEHLPEDTRAMAELFRVLKPGGLMAVTVPRWGPELLCWALSSAYHEVEAGTCGSTAATSSAPAERRRARSRSTAPHARAAQPYWWLKCAVGVDNGDHPLVKAYHRLLVWDMMKAPKITRLAERLLDPVVGKSLVVYLRKPPADERAGTCGCVTSPAS